MLKLYPLKKNYSSFKNRNFRKAGIAVKVMLLSVMLFAYAGFKNNVLAQKPSSAPPATVINTPTDDRAIGWAGGETFNYTNSSWPASSSPRYFYGFPTTLVGVINGYNPLPPGSPCDSAHMANMIYDEHASNLVAGIIVYFGTTNYHYLNTSSIYVTTPLRVRVTVKFTANPGGIAIPVINKNSYLLIKANQNFNVNAIIEVYSPADGSYIPGGPGMPIPAITLFDHLHSDPTSEICTSFDQGTFFTLSLNVKASNAGTYCVGNTINH